MKQIIFFIAALMACISCRHIGTINTKEENPAVLWATIQQNMAPGAEMSSERPFPDVLSEQEVLLKAVEYAYKIGAFDPAYYLYQENPALLTAKIETPVLFYHVPTGDTNVYSLTVVDNDGEILLDVYVRSAVDADMDSFEVTRATSKANAQYSSHYITKREAIRLIKSQFPDKPVSDPIAIVGLRLEGSQHSNNAVFWYFTVTNSINSVPEEYIFSAVINSWGLIAVSNRPAIGVWASMSPHLNWNSMVRLDTPLGIFDRIEAARSAGMKTSFVGNPIRDVKYTPVPLIKEQ